MYKKVSHPLGESSNSRFSLHFDKKVKLECHGAQLSSNGGLLLYRELDEKLKLTETIADQLIDTRRQRRGLRPLVSLFRQSIYSRLGGYDDVNDADVLRYDPVMRQLVGGNAINACAATTSSMHDFEVNQLTDANNLEVLQQAVGRSASIPKTAKRLLLDADSSESPTYGHQDGSAYNGHFGKSCYHPLFCFNQLGSLEGTNLREGQVHSANRWEDVLIPIFIRYRDDKRDKFFRGDAAFAEPGLLDTLESEHFCYAIRLKANARLNQAIAHLTTRPVGRPSIEPRSIYHSFDYQAKSWSRARRVVAKITFFVDQLFPQIGFIVTNLNWKPKTVTNFYNKRGTCEQWIKEGKYAFNWTKLSCQSFDANQARLQLFALAYNLANQMRLRLPKPIASWSLTTLKHKLIKLGARFIRHARYHIFQCAEAAMPAGVFAAIVCNIRNITLDTG